MAVPDPHVEAWLFLNREPRRVLRRAWRSLKLFKRDLEELVRLT